jgi:hypothetical protein
MIGTPQTRAVVIDAAWSTIGDTPQPVGGRRAETHGSRSNHRAAISACPSRIVRFNAFCPIDIWHQTPSRSPVLFAATSGDHHR